MMSKYMSEKYIQYCTIDTHSLPNGAATRIPIIVVVVIVGDIRKARVPCRLTTHSLAGRERDTKNDERAGVP